MYEQRIPNKDKLLSEVKRKTISLTLYKKRYDSKILKTNGLLSHQPIETALAVGLMTKSKPEAWFVLSENDRVV